MISDAMNINGQRYVLREDYDVLAAKVRQLLNADAKGILISSDKDAVYNHMESLKLLVGWTRPDADDGQHGK